MAAASLVSNELTTADDVDLIGALLDSAAGIGVPDRTIDERQYDLLYAHRVLSLVPASWTVTPSRDLNAMKRELAGQQLLLEAHSRNIVGLLQRQRIEVRVLKGMATSRLDYPDPSWRTSGDIDLLVHPVDLERARTVLLAGGCSGSSPAAQYNGYEFGHATTLVYEHSSEIDVHFRLTRLAPAPDGLFDSPAPLPDQLRLALPAELRLMHAASHLMLSPPGFRRLSGLADVSAIRASQNVSLDVVRKHAVAMNCEAIVGAALAVERDIRRLPVDTAHWKQPSWLERASYVRSTRHLLVEHAYELSTIAGTGAKLRYCRKWAFPTDAARSIRGGRWPYFRQALPKRLGGQNPGHNI